MILLAIYTHTNGADLKDLPSEINKIEVNFLVK